MDVLLEKRVNISIKMRPIEHYETHKNFPYYSNTEEDDVSWMKDMNLFNNI